MKNRHFFLLKLLFLQTVWSAFAWYCVLLHNVMDLTDFIVIVILLFYVYDIWND